MKQEIEVDKHKRVGPYPDMYGHGPVAVIQDPELADQSNDEGMTLFVCLDCGYTAHDNRLFAHEECDPEKNGMNTTWREWFAEDNARNLPEADDEEWPIED